MISLNVFAKEKLDALSSQGLKRDIQVTERLPEGNVIREGRELISFCCNDYLNLSHHPKVIQAAKEATGQYGTGAGASRLITGNHPLLAKLEKRLAQIKGTEDACVFGTGYMTNIGIIPTLTGAQDIIFLDELCHACLRAGSDMTGGKILYFRHNDMGHLQELITQNRHKHPNAMIITDGIFSMDGDLAPLDILGRIANENDCWLMSDDAHGLGVVGGGMGSRHMFDPLPDIPLQMGTLSKALGSFGGYICASKPVIDLIKTRARSLIYTTALPPANAAAALAALDIIEDEVDYCRRPIEHATLFAELLGLPEPQSPIVPIIIGDTDRTMTYAAALEEDGFLITGIRPPTVAEGTARLRFTFCANHKQEDIRALAASIKKHGIIT
ncbi:MAG: aminotransferase class I/II-fold pyridoxal phosphate-dependent enzyme [Alphaproteobacteria bacterium]|nr:aminotransferase class I/II-fold pyridoxal phosphate-dependent enzyme [Alphaproteobacteria bacterium]